MWAGTCVFFCPLPRAFHSIIKLAQIYSVPANKIEVPHTAFFTISPLPPPSTARPPKLALTTGTSCGKAEHAPHTSGRAVRGQGMPCRGTESLMQPATVPPRTPLLSWACSLPSPTCRMQGLPPHAVCAAGAGLASAGLLLLAVQGPVAVHKALRYGRGHC